MKKELLGLCVAAAVAPATAKADTSSYEGPYFGQVERVIDGDTFVAQVSIWPTISATVRIRLKGVDAPEPTWRADCPQEKLAGERATTVMENLLPIGTEVRLTQVERDDFGRILADVSRMSDVNGTSLILFDALEEVLRPWNVGEDPIDWCSEFVAE